MPKITFKQPVYDEKADFLKQTCPKEACFDVVEDMEEVGRRKAIVKDPRACTTCRECIDPERGLPDHVKLQKVKDHFIFRIESIGQIPAAELFERALSELSKKCATAVHLLKDQDEEM